jgi:hypothetical protein
MNLSELGTVSVRESQDFYDSIVILEDGEGPRWRFGYSNFKNDPNPDILLLGAYRHPTTGNNLVGGVNLHYLNRKQLEDLAKVLPNIMAANSLYDRYHTGKDQLPDVFKNYYRTYNAAYIHGVEKDTMYPKYGLLKTTADWVKKKLGSIFKSKDQKKKEAQPQYPNDLQTMNRELDQVVQQLQTVPQSSPQAQSPEVQSAKNQRQQQTIDNTEAGIQRQIDEPVRRAYRDAERQKNPDLKPTLPLDKIGPSVDVDQTTKPTRLTQQQKKRRFEQEEQENMQELMEPDEVTEIEAPTDIPEINTPDISDLEEAVIRYYSPRLQRYICETVNLIKV